MCFKKSTSHHFSLMENLHFVSLLRLLEGGQKILVIHCVCICVICISWFDRVVIEIIGLHFRCFHGAYTAYASKRCTGTFLDLNCHGCSFVFVDQLISSYLSVLQQEARVLVLGLSGISYLVSLQCFLKHDCCQKTFFVPHAEFINIGHEDDICLDILGTLSYLFL